METQDKLKKEAVESANELTANLVRIHLNENLQQQQSCCENLQFNHKHNIATCAAANFRLLYNEKNY